MGCGRTLDEIASWSHMNEVQRLAVAARLPDRLAGLGPAVENRTPRPAAPSRAVPVG